MASSPATKPASSASNSQEYVVRVPKGSKKKHSIMKFNAMNNVSISSWTQIKMERENNVAEFKSETDDTPKFGAGSVYNNEQKQIARRKKFGIHTKNYNPDDQPWLLRVGGKAGKKYRGVREGGILDNASFYVFTEAPDGAFEAFPVEEWYNFSPVARYKTLNAEEAEEEFEKRDKVQNYFSIMLKKRLKNEEDDGEGEQASDKSAKFQSMNEFKISEMDEWTDASDPEEESGGSDSEKKTKKTTKKKKKAPVKEKRKARDSAEEAQEDSDEPDEGQEVDYISDDTSSSEDETQKAEPKSKDDLKGVEDEEALRVFDISEDEEEEVKEDEEENANEASPDKNKDPKSKKSSAKKDSSSESSSDSSDSDNIDSDIKSAMFIQKANKGKNGSDNSASSSRANTPTKQINRQSKDGTVKKKMKRKADEGTDASASSQSKKQKTDSSTIEGLSDESIRRYLMRKPITAAELFQKFKSKKCGMSDDQLATTIAAILKRMNLSKQLIKGKIYWSLKE